MKALLSLFAAIRLLKKNAVPNSAVQMHFLPDREYRLATSAKGRSFRSAKMAADGTSDFQRAAYFSRYWLNASHFARRRLSLHERNASFAEQKATLMQQNSQSDRDKALAPGIVD